MYEYQLTIQVTVGGEDSMCFDQFELPSLPPKGSKLTLRRYEEGHELLFRVEVIDHDFLYNLNASADDNDEEGLVRVEVITKPVTPAADSPLWAKLETLASW